MMQPTVTDPLYNNDFRELAEENYESSLGNIENTRDLSADITCYVCDKSAFLKYDNKMKIKVTIDPSTNTIMLDINKSKKSKVFQLKQRVKDSEIVETCWSIDTTCWGVSNNCYASSTKKYDLRLEELAKLITTKTGVYNFYFEELYDLFLLIDITDTYIIFVSEYPTFEDVYEVHVKIQKTEENLTQLINALYQMYIFFGGNVSNINFFYE